MAITEQAVAAEDVNTVASACPLDCPDSCSLDIQVQNGRVVSLDGNHASPTTAGYICGKVRRFADHVYGSDRLLYPAVRDGAKGSGKFRRVSWDDALSLVANRVATIRDLFGGESILPYHYGGSNGWLTDGSLDARLFHRLGASRLARTLCAAPSSAAAGGLYGKMPGVAYEDYVAAKLIVLWGVNISATGIHLAPFVHQAREVGAMVVVIDPRRTPLARQADLHLAIRPGADLPVALAVIDWLFKNDRADVAFLEANSRNWRQLRERAAAWPIDRAAQVAGIDAEALRQFAELYAISSPAVIRCGWGLERNAHGGAATAAVLALPAVAGKFGVRGGGYSAAQGGAWDVDSLAGASAPPPNTRTLNMNRLGASLDPGFAPPVRLLFVYNCNPLSTAPEQNKIRAGLMREDLFTVVHEQTLTDTARYADVVLPATTFLEHHEAHRSYGTFLLQRSRPVIEPVGEARSNNWLFGALCDRLGLTRADDPRTDDELLAVIVKTSAAGSAIAESLAKTQAAAPPCGTRPVPFVDVWPNKPDRRIDLCPESLDQTAPGGLYRFEPMTNDAEFPLTLISPANSKAISSYLYQLVDEIAQAELNAEDAAARGIADGQTVRIFNRSGEVHCRAKVSANIRPGVVAIPKGLWAKHTLNGQTANALCPDTLADLGGGACFNDARVEVAIKG